MSETVNAGASVTFLPGPGPYLAGTNPLSTVTADFNGDGRADLAVGNANGVSVLLGNADGTFQPAVNFTISGSCVSLAIGDFNGDGKVDLAALTFGQSGGVSVLLGNGDGTFQAALKASGVAVGLVLQALAVGDFNGDGKADVAFASSGVTVMLGNGDGTFQAPTTLAVSASSVALGDFNGDGKTDLAAAYGNNTVSAVSVILGNGDGTFQPAVSYATGIPYWDTSYEVVVGDFNGDGKPDLAVANLGTVSVLLGNGNGTFQPEVKYGTAGGSTIQPIAVGDFNGDGKTDLAVASVGGTNVAILLSKSDGTFQPAVNYAVGHKPYGVVVGDFNRDGWADLAFASNTDKNLTILLGIGVTSTPDLAIAKTHVGNFVQGQTGATYTITVSNGGGSTTSQVTVTDSLPVGLTATAISGTGWTCSLGILTCTRGDVLTPGMSYPSITLTVTVASNAPPSVTNTAVASGGGDITTSNDTATDVTTINSLFADLTVNVTHAGRFIQGQTGMTYAITVNNPGAAPAIGLVTMTDYLPAGLTATAISGTGWSCVLGTLSCTRNDGLAAGASYPSITLTVDVATNAPALLTNTATVSGGGEAVVTNNSGSDTIQIYVFCANEGGVCSFVGTREVAYGALGQFYFATYTDGTSCQSSRFGGDPYLGAYKACYVQIPMPSGADLTIVKSHAGNFFQGQTGALYNIAVTNVGASLPTGLTSVTDTLPSGLTATAIAGTGWTCVLGTLTCTRSDAVASGTSFPAITLTVNVAGNAPASVTNTVTISGGGDTNAANNSATDPTTIPPPPDLTVTKAHPGNFVQGQTGATYTITVNNAGATATSGQVSVVDTLPAGLTATAISGTGWACVLGTLTCTRIDALAGGTSYPVITLTVNVANNALASVTNTVAVSGGGEANTANDTANDVTIVNTPPDLTVTKTHSGNFAQGQSGATYTITVRNGGGSATTSQVTVVDSLPIGLTATAVSGSGWTCVPSTLTCTRTDALAASGSYPIITLTVTVANNAPASVTNTVAVSGGGEVNTSNDSASDPTTIVPPLVPDLTVAKSHIGNLAQGQTGATYSITVTNSGTAPTSGTVTIVDTLPTGLIGTGMTGTGWSCTVATMTCTRSDTLAAAASYATITATVSVAANAPTSVTNAVVVSGGGETNTANDSASDPTTINIFVPGTLVTNGTFNTSANGWALGGGCGDEHWISNVGNPPGSVQLNACGESNSDPLASQVVSGLTPGQTYAISVDVRLHVNGSGGAPNGKSFGIFIDSEPSNPIFLGEYLDNTWHAVSSNFTATQSSHTLILAGELDARTPGVSGNSDVSYYIDNVSLAPTTSSLPDLTITKSHNGNFTQGQIGATYTITVRNSGAGPTTSTVTVTDTLPVVLTATAVSGSGWSCTVGTLTCSRSDSLAAGASYPAITVTVTVAANAPVSVPVVNPGFEADVLGCQGGGGCYDIGVLPGWSGAGSTFKPSVGVGGEFPNGIPDGVNVAAVGCCGQSGNDITQDLGFAPAPNTTYTLRVGVGQRSDFALTGYIAELLVGTTSVASATSPTPAAGTFATDMLTYNSGSSPGAQHLVIHLGNVGSGQVDFDNVSLVANGVGSVTNTATVSGGGEQNTSNDTATDVTIIAPAVAPDLTVTKSHTGSFAQGQSGATYTIAINNSGSTSTNGTVSVTDTVPGGLTAAALSGTGWSCTLATVTCTRSDALAAGATHPAITLTVNVANNAPATVTNTVTVSGGGELNTANDTATDPTTIGVASGIAVSPSPVNFGNVTAATTSKQAVTITNAGSVALTVATITVAGTGYTLQNFPVLPLTLAPLATASFYVALTPPSSTTFNGSLTITSNSTTPTVTVLLAGTGIPPALPAATGITVVTDQPLYHRANPVQISGKLTAAGGVGIANTAVTVEIATSGSVRILTASTDSTGTYRTIFQPTSSDGGLFTATAAATSGGTTQSASTNFRILGLLLSQDLLMGATVVVPLNLQVTSDAPFNNLKYALAVTPTGTLTATAVDTVASLASGPAIVVPIALTAPSGTPPPTAVTVVITVTGTDTSSGVTETGTATITVTLRPAVSTPVLIPATMSVGVNRDKSLTRTFNVLNNGYAPMTNTVVTLQNPGALTWVAIGNGNLGTIPAGSASQFQIVISPPSTVPIGIYNVPFNISGGSTALQGSISISVTQSLVGAAAFVVSDDIGTKVSGATVTLYGKANGKTFQGVTDNTGLATIAGVDEGDYSYIVAAQTHDPGSGSVTVTANAIAPVSIILSYDVVSITFTVTPTTIVDQYNVTLNITYVTTLPKPALQVYPDSLNLSFFPEDVPNGKYACHLSITNTHPTANVRNLSLDASQLDVAQPSGQQLHIVFPNGTPYYQVGNLAGNSSVDVGCSATIDSGIVPTHAAGNIVVQANYDYSLDGQVLQGTTTTNVPVAYITPGDFSALPVQFVYDELTDPKNPVLKFDGPSFVYNLTSNRSVRFDLAKPSAVPFSGHNLVAFTNTQGGATMADIINNNQANAFWHTDFSAAKQSLLNKGDSTTFDISTLDGGLTLFQAISAQIAINPAQILGNPNILGFQGQWTDGPESSSIPFYVSTLSLGGIRRDGMGFGFGGGDKCIDSDFEAPGCLPLAAAPLPAHDGTIVIAIDQKVRLERQAYNAILGIGARTTLSNVVASIQIHDASGADASGKFFILVTGDPLGATHGGTVPGPTSVSWQLIPNAGAGGTSTLGAQYQVRAQLSYAVSGVAKTASTQWSTITVLPAPKLSVAYTLPFIEMNGKDTKVRVTVTNTGYGTARNLSILSMNPRIVSSIPSDPLAQLLGDPGPVVNFNLTGASNTADASGFQAGNLTIAFGNVAPGATVSGYWTLQADRKGYFIDISSTFSQSDYQGVALDPLILPPTTSLVPAIAGTIAASSGPGIPGLTVTVSQAGVVIGSDTTNTSGNYYIQDLAAGTYSEQVTDLAGNVVASKTITVLGNQATDFINFVLQNYNPTLAIVVVNGSGPGQSFTADGAVYTTPHSFVWSVGSTHTISNATGNGQQTFAGWDDGETSSSRSVTVTGFGATYNTETVSAATYNRYNRVPVTPSPLIAGDANIDHKWPSINNLGDIVWSQKDSNGTWQVFEQGPSTGNVRKQITSGGAQNHQRPVISDGGTIAWSQDNTGGGLGYAVMRLDPGSTTPSMVEYSSRSVCQPIYQYVDGLVITLPCPPSQEHAAGKNFGISSDGRIISYFTFYDQGYPSDRPFDVNGHALTDASGAKQEFLGYDSPDINSSSALVYSDDFTGLGSIYLATTAKPTAYTIIDGAGNPQTDGGPQLPTGSNPPPPPKAQFPHISDGAKAEIAYLKNKANIDHWPGQDPARWVDLGLWADIAGSGPNATIVYERVVNGYSQIWIATPANDTFNPKQCGACSASSGYPGKTDCGDPIDIGSGNVYERVDDYSTLGANAMSFTRYYNSMASSGTFAYSLGRKWRSTFDRYLGISSVNGVPTAVIAERMDGQVLSFTKNGSIWVSDSDIDMQLTQSGSTWTLTTRDDSIETYNVNAATGLGILSSIKARNGYTQNFTYDTSVPFVAQLVSVTDTYHRVLSFTYSNGLLQTMTTPDGLVLTYGFTALTGGNRLTTVAYSTTPQTSQTYLYENAALPFSLTGIIDENGSRYGTWTYDQNGRGLSSEHAGGADRTTVAYDDITGNRTVTNALGQQTVYKYTKLQGVPKVIEIDRLATATTATAVQKFTYDTNGFLASATDWNGNLTTYVNDVHGQPTVVTEASGTAQARATTTKYHSTFHLPLNVTTPGVTTTFTYDPGGNLLTKTDSDTTKQSVPYSTIFTARTTTYAWANSLLASQQGPRGDVKELNTYTYDSSGALTATTNALNQTSKITKHLPCGLPQTSVDPNGVTTNFDYDARLRLVRKTVVTSSGPLVTTYTYDAAGNLLTVTQPDGSALTNSYDAAHRLIGVTDLLRQTTTYTLDGLGNRTLTTVSDASGTQQRKHSETFDAFGRVLTDVGGAGQTTTYAYDSNGNATSITDPLSRVTRQTFDALNRRTQVTDPAKGVTSMTYDAHDRPLTVKDAKGNTTSYVYDGFGNRIQQSSPDTGTTVYRYDLAGNTVQRVDAAGATVNYTFDALDRVTRTAYSKSASDNVAYTYDQPSGGFGVGRLTGVQDGAGTLQRAYDERGTVVSETRALPAATLRTGYTWDAASRLASIAYPSGWSVVYARDTMGRVTGISGLAPGAGAKPQTLLSAIAYQPFGPVSAQTYGNGVKETRAYDPDYRLTSLTDAGTTLVQSLAYGYDAANNVLSIADGVNPANSQTLAYDALDQLASAKGAYGVLGYTYDAVGNRLTSTTALAATTYSYASTNNRLASVAGLTWIQTVGYTPTGNIGSMTETGNPPLGFSYNDAGRLTTVQKAGLQIAQYTYDAFGRRLIKMSSTAGMYQYDMGGHLLEEADNQGKGRVDYVYLEDRPVATLSPPDGKVYFLNDDKLGTPQVATDPSQTVIWGANYEPFGTTSTGFGVIVQNLRLPGQEFDVETGFYHNGFRDYLPQWGRYLEADPAGVKAGPSSFTYSKGSPLVNTDPMGLWATEVHHTLIDFAFPGLSQELIEQIDSGSDAVDSLANQGSDTAFQHAMRASQQQTVEKARAAACAFISERMAVFNKFKDSASSAERLKAYFALGEALHPVMDYTSPSHSGWQVWDPYDHPIVSFQGHGDDSPEDIWHLDFEVERQTRQKMLDVYNGATPSTVLR
jgi:RHS repeat-associated protein/uncharacterized repeat protein (TIGR01451 family)